MEWQPIETAPKDGTFIIVCSDTGNVWCEVRWTKRSRTREEHWEHLGFGQLPFNPTYWIPIPKAPKQ